MRTVLVCSALGLLACSAGGGGGNWVDAPQACMGAWAAFQMGDVGAIAQRIATGAPPPRPSSTDLKEAFEKVLETERKKGTPEAELKEGRAAFEAIIAAGARAVCGNIGKSYTGDWECTAQKQRVRCK
jgi:hypothetical protein